jgi:hypothetical protein
MCLDGLPRADGKNKARVSMSLSEFGGWVGGEGQRRQDSSGPRPDTELELEVKSNGGERCRAVRGETQRVD